MMKASLRSSNALTISVVTAILVGCDGLAPTAVGTQGASDSDRAAEPAAKPKAKALEYLGSFETLNRLGFTPDDICYSPQEAHLFIGAAADGVGARGVFELTVDGDLVASYALPDPEGGYLGFGIDRVNSGPKVGHFFLPEYNGTPQVGLYEFDRSFSLLAIYPVVGKIQPGDGIAYNERTRTLFVLDAGFVEWGERPSTMIEVTTNGDMVGTVSIPHVNGFTFNQQTGTYFGVQSNYMVEFSQSGEPLAWYDMPSMGIGGGVGITSGQGKLFIADECDPANSGGRVHILKLKGR